MGGWNAKVGSTKTPGITGGNGLGDMNERGRRLMEFCQENKLVLTNTMFQLSPRRLYTLESRGGIVRNQIDFIMIKDRFRHSVKLAKTYPGADINSDHNPVICKIHIKLKHQNKTENQASLDLNELKKAETQKKFAVKVNNYFDKLSQETKEQTPEEEIETMWSNIKNGILNAVRLYLLKRMRRKMHG